MAKPAGIGFADVAFIHLLLLFAANINSVASADIEKWDMVDGCDTSDQWQPFNHSCYRRLKLNPPRGWRDANEQCKEVGGHLAVLRTKAENDFIRASMMPDPDPTGKYMHYAMWMGLSLQWATCDDCNNVQRARWVDDTPLKESELLPYPITLLTERYGKYPWQSAAPAGPDRCGRSDCCTLYYTTKGFSMGNWGVYSCDDIMMWALCQKKPGSK